MKNRKLRILIFFGSVISLLYLSGCKAKPPSRIEKKVVQESKDLVIGGKDWQNPVPDNASSVKLGGEHFQHHCEVCHGLDGHATGVPFALSISPPVPDLGTRDIQKYSDGQLKWIIENGIRLTGMPKWKGFLTDEEMWQVVRYIRHLPPRGSLGIPEVYAREREEHAQTQKEHTQKEPMK